jgi:hypothetical protein
MECGKECAEKEKQLAGQLSAAAPGCGGWLAISTAQPSPIYLAGWVAVQLAS